MEDLNDSNIISKASEASDQVISKEKTCVQILGDLGPFLTDVNLGKRKVGVNFLSEFLSNLPKDFMNEDECQLFATFYQDRMNDHHSMTPFIITGLKFCHFFVEKYTDYLLF